MIRANQEPTLGELFSSLGSEIGTLISQEARLAKTELAEKASNAGKDVGYVVAGGALAYAGLLVILAGVVVGLAVFIPLWLSALLVGLVVVGGGYLLAQKGLNALKHEDFTPRETIASLKETVEWAKTQTR